MFGPDHPDTAVSFINLAKDFYWQRKYPEAVANYRIGLADAPQGVGQCRRPTRGKRWSIWPTPWPPWPASTNWPARWDAAGEARQEVVALRIERYGADDGRVADARQAVEDIDRVKKLSDVERKKLAEADTAYLNAAKLYTDESKYEAAASAVRASLEGRKAILGDEHRKTLQCENLLANCLYAQRKYSEAEPLYQHVWTSASAIRRRACRHRSELQQSGQGILQPAAIRPGRGRITARPWRFAARPWDRMPTTRGRRWSIWPTPWPSWPAKRKRPSIGRPRASRPRPRCCALRRERYGEHDWHANEARLALADADKLATLSKAERDRLAKAAELHRKAAELIPRLRLAAPRGQR